MPVRLTTVPGTGTFLPRLCVISGNASAFWIECQTAGGYCNRSLLTLAVLYALLYALHALYAPHALYAFHVLQRKSNLSTLSIDLSIDIYIGWPLISCKVHRSFIFQLFFIMPHQNASNFDHSSRRIRRACKRRNI